MLKFIKYTFVGLIIIILVSSCHSDSDESLDGSETTQILTTPIYFEEVTGDLVGVVTDIYNTPISGATVHTYSSNTTTNDLGIFRFDNINMDRQGTYVRISANGYINGYDWVYPDNAITTSRVSLKKVNNEIAFSSVQGGSISFDNNSKVNFGEGILSSQSGSNYSGDIIINGFSIFPEDHNVGNVMPSGLIGIDNKNRHRVLGIYTGAFVKASTPEMEALKIKSDKNYQLEMLIPVGLRSQAPEQIPFWYFNDNSGYWIEKGMAKISGNNYIVDVPNFGYWICATPYAMVQICGKVVNDTELPSQNYQLKTTVNNTIVKIGYTDSEGFYCGQIPAGEEIEIEVLNPYCDEVIGSMIVDPIEEISDLPTIVIDSEDKLQMINVKCKDEDVKNAVIIVNANDNFQIFNSNENGVFEINHSELFCNQETTVTVNTMEDNIIQSIQIVKDELSPREFNICVLDCEIEIDLLFEKDQECAEGPYDRVIAIVNGGTGNYTYMWSDGSNDETMLEPVFATTLCVTVTDMETMCEVDKCVIVNIHNELLFSHPLVYNATCNSNSGVIETDVIGGYPPYEYLWEGPDGYTHDEPIATELAKGKYFISITDSKNCTTTMEATIDDPNTLLGFLTSNFCDVTLVQMSIIGGAEPYDIAWNGGQLLDNVLYVTDPGEYFVTVTDNNDCVRTDSIAITNVGLLPDLIIDYSCEAGTIIFSNLIGGDLYYIYEEGTNTQIFYPLIGDQVVFSVFESGYNFEFGVQDINSTLCMVDEEVVLPHFEGLSTTKQNTSCAGCLDGQIFINIDESATCNDCIIGTTIVLDKDLLSDVTIENMNGDLKSGTYYVIVRDNISGCFISHEEVIIE
ncbi:MAG: carboxypeptidase-like regulatory domain-containing protein [Saprospiraceae bacterium]